MKEDLTAAECARLLGISVRTVQRACARGEIPSYLPAGLQRGLRIPRSYAEQEIERIEAVRSQAAS